MSLTRNVPQNDRRLLSTATDTCRSMTVRVPLGDSPM